MLTSIRGPDRPGMNWAELGAGLDDGRWVVAGPIDTGPYSTVYRIAALNPEGLTDSRCPFVESQEIVENEWLPELEPVDDLVLEEGTLELADLTVEAEDIDFVVTRACP